MDGVTVYNPSHLGGIFSNFIVDGVKEAELIKGAYNAEYGGRLSAVLNIISREGNQKKFEGKANSHYFQRRQQSRDHFTKVHGYFQVGEPILIKFFKMYQPSLPITFTIFKVIYIPI